MLFFAAMTLWSAANTCPRANTMHTVEQFDPRLSSIDSIDKAEQLIRRQIGAHAGDARTLTAIDAFVRARFYHDLSETRLCDANWFAVIASKLWDQLKYPVHADRVLQHQRAWCTQQARVFEALAERFGMTYGTVRISTIHMIPAATINGRWYAFDPDVEMRLGGVPLAGIMDGTQLDFAYPNHRLDYFGEFGARYRDAARRGQIRLSQVDENPAFLGGIAQLLLLFISKWGWALLALMWWTSRPAFRPTARRLLEALRAGTLWRAKPSNADFQHLLRDIGESGSCLASREPAIAGRESQCSPAVDLDQVVHAPELTAAQPA